MDYPRKRSKLWGLLRRRWKWLAALFLLAVVPPFAADRYVEAVAADGVFREIDELPARQVALVLGTAKWAPSGRINLYYQRRLQAAWELYQAGKVSAILVSGDNSREGYDEPTFMRNDLIQLGVPEAAIYRDFAGFRTLDSVLRARDVFQLDGFVAVSQEFHCLRAVYLGREAGMDVVGYCARDVGGAVGAKVRAREVLARLQAVLDMRVLDRKPKYLGEPVPIPLT